MALASTKFFTGLVLVGLLLFLPAGTIHYPCGWLLMAVLFVPMFIVGVLMQLRSPELLRKRLAAKEKEAEQKSVVALSGIMFIAAFVVDKNFWIGAIIILLGNIASSIDLFVGKRVHVNKLINRIATQLSDKAMEKKREEFQPIIDSLISTPTQSLEN